MDVSHILLVLRNCSAWWLCLDIPGSWSQVQAWSYLAVGLEWCVDAHFNEGKQFPRNQTIVKNICKHGHAYCYMCIRLMKLPYSLPGHSSSAWERSLFSSSLIQISVFNLVLQIQKMKERMRKLTEEPHLQVLSRGHARIQCMWLIMDFLMPKPKCSSHKKQRLVTILDWVLIETFCTGASIYYPTDDSVVSLECRWKYYKSGANRDLGFVDFYV